MTEYRCEHKYLCCQEQLEILRARLGTVMGHDPHYSGSSYRVRSLYFDDDDDTAFWDNESGADRRVKHRIRVYEEPRERILLENKFKAFGKTRKDSCVIEKSLCVKIIGGQRIEYDKRFGRALSKFYVDSVIGRLVPKTIVEYERTAFVYPVGNVRITFDRNISYSREFRGFFKDRIDLVPVLPSGRHIFEVKYDELIPDFIAQLLELGDLQRTALSKYCLSRLAEKGEC